MASLGVNIDHIANVRQARRTVEPDPVSHALLAELGGADGITVHLREDRRHIQDADVHAIAAIPGIRLNLEMACTPAMTAFALQLRPAAVCLVPESREEVTTEGGLDVAGQLARVRETTQALKAASIEVSLFIGPDAPQIEAAVAIGAPVIELHTGAFANAWKSPAAVSELERLRVACELAHRLGLIVNAGHGINYDNIRAILTLPHLNELNIGHSIVARALFTGIRSSVAEMKANLTKKV